MSKQYLSLPALPRAHRTDIFALAITPAPQPTLISVSAESAIKIHSVAPSAGNPARGPTPATTASADARAAASAAADLESDPYPLTQVLHAAHPLGAHHLAVSADGTRMASAGFGGECRVWACREGMWAEDGYVGSDPTVSAHAPPTDADG
jgi:superkiller protein 8